MADLPQFLYRIQPTRVAMLSEGPSEQEAQILDQHFTYLKELTERGVVQLAGRTLNTDATAFGIVVFLAESEAAASTIMRDDPAIKTGLMRAELFPYRIALIGSSRPMDHIP